MSQAVLFFIFGAVSSAFVCAIMFSFLSKSEKEELIKLRSKIEISNDFKEIISKDFAKIASETIKNEQEDLRKQNREALEEKIIPLSKELSEFKDKVEKFNISGVENTTKILSQISSLEKNNKIIEAEAKNLVNALTKNQNVKGAYGENLLDTILQSCGMQEGIHYTKQFSTISVNLSDNMEHRIRPDFVINLPNNKHITIDSKVTLSSYLDSVENPEKIKDFKNEVKKRIADLANKNYQNAENLTQPDFVLMYMPVESSVNLLYEDRELIENAYKMNVIIVGTSSLLTTIRLANQLIAQQKQNENIKEIVNASTGLYETFTLFCNELIDLKRKFELLDSQLIKTINRFKRGNKTNPSLFSQVEALKKMGISSVLEIPEDFLNNSEDTQDRQIYEIGDLTK